MQYPYDPTALPAAAPLAAGQTTATRSPAPRCALFETAREAACADEELGRLWLDLFDDANL